MKDLQADNTDEKNNHNEHDHLCESNNIQA